MLTLYFRPLFTLFFWVGKSLHIIILALGTHYHAALISVLGSCIPNTVKSYVKAPTVLSPPPSPDIDVFDLNSPFIVTHKKIHYTCRSKCNGMFALIYFSDPFYLVVPKHLFNSARTPLEYKPP